MRIVVTRVAGQLPTTMTHTTFRSPHFTFDRPLCRLGLATRGTNRLTPADIRFALDRGVNFLNWCGNPDSLSETIAALGPRRREVVICVQFEARTATDARTELASILLELRTNYIDVLTFYYVEEESEWRQIVGPGGALDYWPLQAQGAARKGALFGVTKAISVPLAADMGPQRPARPADDPLRPPCPRRAEMEVALPVTDALGLPVHCSTPVSGAGVPCCDRRRTTRPASPCRRRRRGIASRCNRRR